MLRIIVRLHGQKTQMLELSDPATIYWAGRNDNCQIPLKIEGRISRQHFKIFFLEGTWRLEVVSRFVEVQIGEEAVSKLILKEGLSFSLSPYEFQVESSLDLAVDKSRVSVVGSDFSDEINVEDLDDKTMTLSLDREVQAVLKYKNPDSKTEKAYMLTKDSTLIGRDSKCDIILDDARVSRRQFKIIKKSMQFFLIDKQGVNGTYLNKKKISNKDPILLKSGDSISVLNHKLIFEVRDPDFESKMQKVQHLTLLDPLASSSPLTPINQNHPSGDGSLVVSANSSNNIANLVLSTPMGEQSFPQQENTLNNSESIDSKLATVKALNFWGLKLNLTNTNIIRLVLAAVIIIAVLIAINDEDADFDATKEVATRPADPFSKLSPEEQKQVKVQYELAKDLYTKGNYQLAKEELNKVHAKIPSYLDSEELARFIEVGIQSAQEREQQERLKKEAAESEERIQNTVLFCRQQISPATTSDEVEVCLADAIQLNPEHDLILKLRADVAKLEEDRKTREAELALRKAQVAELAKQYKIAFEIGEKDPLKGIEAFKEFLKLTMPDPDKLLEKAKADIKRLDKKIKVKVKEAISAVKGLVESGKHKDAIMALERATEVSPNDETLRDEIDRITEELRKKMQTLYQEAILEENIGNIDTAKDRWRKILEQDIPNGEYFAKAKSKLKKYGGV